VVEHHRQESLAGLVEAGITHGDPCSLARGWKRVVHPDDLPFASEEAEAVTYAKLEAQRGADALSGLCLEKEPIFSDSCRTGLKKLLEAGKLQHNEGIVRLGR